MNLSRNLFILLCSISINAHATVFWDDELESGNTGYSLPTGYKSTPMTFDTSVKFSGSGSMRYNFGPECYPDASAQTNCGGFIDRGFTATNTFFRRVYVRLSAEFVVSDVFTKLFRSNTNSNLVSNWWGMGCCGWNRLGVENQNVPNPVVKSNYEIPRGRWVCLETQEQLNTPGVANGISRAWANGAIILDKTDVKFRQMGDTFQFVSNRFYRQTGLGYIWFDRLAVGDSRIGCIGSVLPAENKPPKAPLNLMVF